MMFSLTCTLLILLAIGVSGQTDNIDNSQPSNVGKGYPFGKLRLSEDGKKEELILSSDHIQTPALDQDQPSNGHPLPSPCLGSGPSTRLAFPKDKTKYIQCRDEFHYEILTCPKNGEYVEQSNSCELTIPTVDRCEAEKPCLNDGKCSVQSNSTLKCVCREDWTGERCETPLNSCVTKPCGPSADCRALKTIDSEQDYVCVCHTSKGYGLSCQEVVSNPCLTTSEQFFPYAFSQRAYVQCNGELIYFQPCGPSLYWNQEGKICDRKPPAKIETPALITKVISGSENNVNDETKVTTTTVQTEQEISSVQKGKDDKEGIFAFVPARVANRQQFQSNNNNQQSFSTQIAGEKQPEMSNQRFQTIDSNQNRPDVLSNTNQWTNQQIDTTTRQSLTIQSSRQQQQQQWPQSTVQQWAPKSVDGFSVNSNLGQSQIKQTFPQQQQMFSNRQWSNQVPAVKTQTWEAGSQMFQDQDNILDTTTTPQTLVRFHGQDQHWQSKPISQSNTFNTQHGQTFVNQPKSWKNQQSFLETTTTPSQDFENQNLPEESWQSKSIGQSNTFSTQHGQSFVHKPQSWQESQTLPETTTTPQNLVRFQGQDQSWQQRPISQSVNNQLPQSNIFNTQHTQSFVNQPHAWQSQNQQLALETTTAAQTLFSFPSQKLQDQEQTWQTKPLTQTTGNKFFQTNSLNNRNFVSQPQSWQTSQTVQNQQQSMPTTLDGSSIEKNNRVNTGIQQNTQWSVKPQTVQSQQSWQNRGTNQFRQNQIQPESSMTKAQQWAPIGHSESSADLNEVHSSIGEEGEEGEQSQFKQQQQILPQQNQVFGTQQRFNPQTFVETTTTTVAPTDILFQNLQTPQQQDQPWKNQITNQQTLNTGHPIKPQSNQVFAFKPKQWTVERQNVDDQDTPQTSQSWSQTQNQQPLISKPSTSQFTNLDDTRSTFNSQSQPWSQSGKLTGNSFETTSTLPSKTSLQVLLPLSARSWQSGRTNDQQTTTDQRQPLDSISTFSSGSWKSRS